MGDWSTALLVRTATATTVRAAVERIVEGQGFVLAGPKEAADREMVIGNAGAGWIAVADVPLARGHNLTAMAGPLGAALKATAVTCGLFDGDTTTLDLYVGGKRAESVATGEDPQTTRSPRWKDALGPKVTLARFYEEVARLRDQADSIDELAGLLGCNPGALRGDKPGGKVTRLRLRLRERPRWELPAEGPGRLEPFFASTAEIPSGAETMLAGQGRRVRVHGRNGGGAFRGLRIEIGGEAIARGLLVPTLVQVGLGIGGAGAHRVELRPAAAGESVRTHTIVLPDVDVP